MPVSWKKVKPHTIKSRKNVKTKYGNKCFLDSRRLKYPICSKYSGKINCKGIYGALYYLNLNIAKLLKNITRKKQDKTKQDKTNLQSKLINKKLKKYNTLKKRALKLKNKHC